MKPILFDLLINWLLKLLAKYFLLLNKGINHVIVAAIISTTAAYIALQFGMDICEFDDLPWPFL